MGTCLRQSVDRGFEKPLHVVFVDLSRSLCALAGIESCWNSTSAAENDFKLLHWDVCAGQGRSEIEPPVRDLFRRPLMMCNSTCLVLCSIDYIMDHVIVVVA